MLNHRVSTINEVIPRVLDIQVTDILYFLKLVKEELRLTSRTR